jgi:Domain of unknown function (DUF4124)
MKALIAQSFSAALATVILLAAPAASPASSEIYVCRDADGRKVYQNTGGGKGCVRLDVQPALTVPAPRQQTARAAPELKAISPASFPRVDTQTQRTRDGDRRRILEDELGAEETKLQTLRLEYNGGQAERLPGERSEVRYQERVSRLHADLQRTENNIASLKRELALLTRQ